MNHHEMGRTDFIDFKGTPRKYFEIESEEKGTAAEGRRLQSDPIPERRRQTVRRPSPDAEIEPELFQSVAAISELWQQGGANEHSGVLQAAFGSKEPLANELVVQCLESLIVFEWRGPAPAKRQADRVAEKESKCNSQDR